MANLSVSGVVVNADDKPVGGVSVVAIHAGVPGLGSHTCTNAEDRFKIEDVCHGWVGLTAHISGKTNLTGSVETE